MSDGPSVLEILRDDRAAAKKRLETIKDHDLKQWAGETDQQFDHRRALHHERRANARKIYEGYDGRIKVAVDRKAERTSHKENPYDKHGGGIVPFDSTVDGVVEWIAWELTEARNHGWDGYAFSGFRTPAKSIAICQGICGQDYCPGRCAGASSNHAKKGDGQGAVDLTGSAEFEQIAFTLGLRLRNDLPADLPHMSATGH